MEQWKLLLGNRNIFGWLDLYVFRSAVFDMMLNKTNEINQSQLELIDWYHTIVL